MACIQNDFLSVRVKTRGAELSSICERDGSTEYLWQGDPSVWTGQAPILFPIVGKLAGGNYRLGETDYELSKHGFARQMDFGLVRQSDTACTFQLMPTEFTRAAYPFEFVFTVTYQLNARTLDVTYAVQNCGDSTMPFSIGAHPAFNLPGPLESCFLQFEHEESLRAFRFAENGQLQEESEAVVLDGNRLRLTPSLFERDALVFKQLTSSQITLGSDGSEHRIRIEFPGFPNLGLWAKPAAPYVCIEPWFGYDDPQTPYGEIWNKPGILTLDAGQTFESTHRINIEPLITHSFPNALQASGMIFPRQE